METMEKEKAAYNSVCEAYEKLWDCVGNGYGTDVQNLMSEMEKFIELFDKLKS